MSKRTLDVDLSNLATEQPNPAASNLDVKSSLEIARTINAEDSKIAAAVKRALPEIAQAIDHIVASFRCGGRLIYVGTGTSGRLGALDAAECPPTFNVAPRMVQYIMAGGASALGRAVEADEDSRSFGEREIASRKPTKKDVVIGLAASGRTPFTLAAIEYARRKGATTVAVTCNHDTPLEAAADLAIVVEVGPEVVSGSTRMKAGTAQKMVLNMLSTGAFTMLGYVYDNLMVNVRPKNSKLRERAIAILQRATGASRPAAQKTLATAGSVQAALVMLKAGATRTQAERALKAAEGDVRRAIVSALS